METYLAHIPHEQDTKTIIEVIVAYAPPLEQLLREAYHIAWAYIIHRNNSHLGNTVRLKGVAYRVEGHNSLAREYAIGISHKAPTIDPLHILHIAHTIALSLNAHHRDAKKQDKKIF
jgi:hypothetical protein